MKNLKVATGLLLASLVVPTEAAECPSAKAAKIGADYGYNRDRNAAIENERRESNSSSVVGKCIGGITSIVVVPTFPSLGSIFTSAAEKVCRVANDKIREATNIPNFGVPGFPTTAVPVPILPPPQPGLPAPTTPDFWGRLWR